MDDLRVKWYGTAAVLLELNGTRLLFDPFIPVNKRLYMPSAEDWSAVRYIFVTHGHYDHTAAIPAVLKINGGSATVCCTAAPRETLIQKGVEERCLRIVAPGGSVTAGPFEIQVYKGKHIVFDKRLIIKTFCSPRLLLNLRNLFRIIRASKGCDEAGETVVYGVRARDKNILLMGSMNLDGGTEYPTQADLLILPFQGRSDVNEYAMDFIRRLQPKKVLLTHFDDSFPPVSSAVDTARFLSSMKQAYPGIPVIRPQAGGDWIYV